MFDIERFLEEKMNPVFRAYYSLWVHYWPLWRSITSRAILRKWEDCHLMKEGQTVLDFGCGTGDFTIPAAQMVKESGKVYALDYFKRQLGIVKKRVEKEGLTNVETIHSDGDTNLPDESVDVIWMCDVLHEIGKRRSVMEELHRVLKKGGSLVIYDGMGDKVLEFTENLFALRDKDSKFLRFSKITC